MPAVCGIAPRTGAVGAPVLSVVVRVHPVAEAGSRVAREVGGPKQGLDELLEAAPLGHRQAGEEACLRDAPSRGADWTRVAAAADFSARRDRCGQAACA